MDKKRITYLLVSIETIFVGLISRKFEYYLPNYINIYLGDALWAIMVYLLCRIIFSNNKTILIILLSLIFCYSIELSQLYHSIWIDKIRANKIGGLILGYGFQWTDIVAYTLGILFVSITEKWIQNQQQAV